MLQSPHLKQKQEPRHYLNKLGGVVIKTVVDQKLKLGGGESREKILGKMQKHKSVI